MDDGGHSDNGFASHQEWSTAANNGTKEDGGTESQVDNGEVGNADLEGYCRSKGLIYSSAEIITPQNLC